MESHIIVYILASATLNTSTGDVVGFISHDVKHNTCDVPGDSKPLHWVTAGHHLCCLYSLSLALWWYLPAVARGAGEKATLKTPDIYPSWEAWLLWSSWSALNLFYVFTSWFLNDSQSEYSAPLTTISIAEAKRSGEMVYLMDILTSSSYHILVYCFVVKPMLNWLWYYLMSIRTHFGM